MNQMPLPVHNLNIALSQWWRRYKKLVYIFGSVLLLVISLGLYTYDSRQSIKYRLQTWLVSDSIKALQKMDSQLSAHLRQLDGKTNTVEETLANIDGQYAADRTQTVALQQQLQDAMQSSASSVTPSAKPSASSSPKASPSHTASSPVSPNPTPATETSIPAGGKVNINTASVAQLDSLPGIGATFAQRIVEYREQNGKFASVDDLLKVKGIGTSMLSKIRDLVEL